MKTKNYISMINPLCKWLTTYVIRFLQPYAYKEMAEWKKLKGKYRGRRVFLIANGPSLNITPLYLLKDELTMVFNRSTLILERLNYIPTFYMIEDTLVAKTAKEDVEYFVKNAKLSFLPDVAKGDLTNFRKLLDVNVNVRHFFQNPNTFWRFSRNLPFCSKGSTVIYSAFQVLDYLGFDEVFVVGNDMNYVIHKSTDVIKEESLKSGEKNQSVRSQKDDDPNHFDPRYFGKGKEYHQPTQTILRKMLQNLDWVAEEYKKDGVKIVNCGYNSAVQCFPKQDFYEALGYSQEKIDAIFEELVKSLGFASLTSFLSSAVVKKEIWDERYDIVGVETGLATTAVKAKVLEYLPVGPYKDVVYFVNRNFIK